MAIRFTSASSEYLTRTTTLLNYNADYTFGGWVYVAEDLATWQNIFCLTGSTGASNLEACQISDTNVLNIYNISNGTERTNNNGSTLTGNTWYHVMVTRTGSQLRCYLNGVINITDTTSAVTSRTAIARNSLGAWYDTAATDFAGARFAGWTAWTRALSAGEVLEASRGVEPHSSTNLFDHWRLRTDTDLTGTIGGAVWTAVNTPSTEADPGTSWSRIPSHRLRKSRPKYGKRWFLPPKRRHDVWKPPSVAAPYVPPMAAILRRLRDRQRGVQETRREIRPASPAVLPAPAAPPATDLAAIVRRARDRMRAVPDTARKRVISGALELLGVPAPSVAALAGGVVRARPTTVVPRRQPRLAPPLVPNPYVAPMEAVERRDARPERRITSWWRRNHPSAPPLVEDQVIPYVPDLAALVRPHRLLGRTHTWPRRNRPTAPPLVPNPYVAQLAAIVRESRIGRRIAAWWRRHRPSAPPLVANPVPPPPGPTLRYSQRPEEFVLVQAVQPDPDEPITGYVPTEGRNGVINPVTGQPFVLGALYTPGAATTALDPWGETDYTATLGGAIHTLTVPSRGGPVCKWRTQTDGYDVRWLRRVDVGLGTLDNERWREAFNTAEEFEHNPTGCGAILKPDPVTVADFYRLPWSPHIYRNVTDDSTSRMSEACLIPLEFQPGGEEFGADGDHGGDAATGLHALWWLMRMFPRVQANWQGRKNVHHKVLWSYQPKQWDETVSPLVCYVQNGLSFVDLFDEAYFCDLATDTMGPKIDFAVAPNDHKSTWMASMDQNVAIVYGQSVVVSASQVRSGYGAAFFRRVSDDFCIAIAAKLTRNKDGCEQPYLLEVDTFPRTSPSPASDHGEDTNVGQKFVLTNFSDTRRKKGWIGQQFWFYTGSFYNAKAAMRQLYNDGALDLPIPTNLPAEALAGTWPLPGATFTPAIASGMRADLGKASRQIAKAQRIMDKIDRALRTGFRGSQNLTGQ